LAFLEGEAMKRRYILRVMWGLSLGIFLLTGCGGRDREMSERTKSPLPTPDIVMDVSSPLQTPSPGLPDAAVGGSSPIQTPSLELPDWDAEPAPGKAILRGRIEVAQRTVLVGELFLARAMPTSDPEIDMLELDEAKSPRASINRSTGEFIFLNVEPGKYGLIVWEPLNSSSVNDPATGETFLIELAADQVTDVSTLYFP
jgi:hypothetical protein